MGLPSDLKSQDMRGCYLARFSWPTSGLAGTRRPSVGPIGTKLGTSTAASACVVCVPKEPQPSHRSRDMCAECL